MTRLMYGLFGNNSNSSCDSGYSYDGHTSIVLDEGDETVNFYNEKNIRNRFQCLNEYKISNHILARLINLFFFTSRIFIYTSILLLYLMIILVGYWCGSVTYNEWNQSQTISISYLFLTFFFLLLGCILLLSGLVTIYIQRDNFRIDCIFIFKATEIFDGLSDNEKNGLV